MILIWSISQTSTKMLLSETLLCHDTDLVYITNINQDVTLRDITVSWCWFGLYHKHQPRCYSQKHYCVMLLIWSISQTSTKMLLSETLLCHDTDLIYITNINQDVTLRDITVSWYWFDLYHKHQPRCYSQRHYCVMILIWSISQTSTKMLLSETLLCHDTDLIYITNINQDVTLRDITVSWYWFGLYHKHQPRCYSQRHYCVMILIWSISQTSTKMLLSETYCVMILVWSISQTSTKMLLSETLLCHDADLIYITNINQDVTLRDITVSWYWFGLYHKHQPRCYSQRHYCVMILIWSISQTSTKMLLSETLLCHGTDLIYITNINQDVTLRDITVSWYWFGLYHKHQPRCYSQRHYCVMILIWSISQTSTKMLLSETLLCHDTDLVYIININQDVTLGDIIVSWYWFDLYHKHQPRCYSQRHYCVMILIWSISQTSTKMLLSETLLCHDTDLVYITNINQDVTLRDITVSWYWFGLYHKHQPRCYSQRHYCVMILIWSISQTSTKMLLSETLLCHDTDLIYITNINQDVTLRDITVSWYWFDLYH